MAPTREKVTRQREITEPEIVDTNPDLQMVKSDGATVLGFLQPATLIAFFKRAGELERHASSLLARAKALQAPTNGQEDARIVAVLQADKSAKTEALEHWAPRSVFYQLHKRLIAAEQRTTGMIDEAVAIAQRLHNTYVTQAEAKARIEADVQRRKAEGEARATREAELARLEADALKAEEASTDLSGREAIFVEQVALGIAADKAAGNVGFKDACKQAARLMSLPKIQQAITAKQEASAIRRQAEAVKDQPLAVNMERVEADIVHTGSERVTWTGEIYDEAAFISAFKGGAHGIPDNCITFNQKGCTELARSLKTLANIPGFRAVKKTTTI